MSLQAVSPRLAPSAAAPRPARARQALQLTLTSQPAAVSKGRRVVQEAMRAWELDAAADTAVLLASELLTNAVRATSAAAPAPGRGEPLVLTLQHTGSGVLLGVWDSSPAPAAPQNPGPTDESGRGLLLMEALSSAWGQHAVDSGKIVWCEITVPTAD